MDPRNEESGEDSCVQSEAANEPAATRAPDPSCEKLARSTATESVGMQHFHAVPHRAGLFTFHDSEDGADEVASTPGRDGADSIHCESDYGAMPYSSSRAGRVKQRGVDAAEALVPKNDAAVQTARRGGTNAATEVVAAALIDAGLGDATLGFGVGSPLVSARRPLARAKSPFVDPEPHLVNVGSPLVSAILPSELGSQSAPAGSPLVAVENCLQRLEALHRGIDNQVQKQTSSEHVPSRRFAPSSPDSALAGLAAATANLTPRVLDVLGAMQEATRTPPTVPAWGRPPRGVGHVHYGRHEVDSEVSSQADMCEANTRGTRVPAGGPESYIHREVKHCSTVSSRRGQRHDQRHDQHQSPRGLQLLGGGIGVLGTSPLRNNTGLGKQAPLRSTLQNRSGLTPRTMASHPPSPYYDDCLRRDYGEGIAGDTDDAERQPRLPLPEEDKYLKILRRLQARGCATPIETYIRAGAAHADAKRAGLREVQRRPYSARGLRGV